MIQRWSFKSWCCGLRKLISGGAISVKGKDMHACGLATKKRIKCQFERTITPTIILKENNQNKDSLWQFSSCLNLKCLLNYEHQEEENGNAVLYGQWWGRNFWYSSWLKFVQNICFSNQILLLGLLCDAVQNSFWLLAQRWLHSKWESSDIFCLYRTNSAQQS